LKEIDIHDPDLSVDTNPIKKKVAPLSTAWQGLESLFPSS